MKHEKPKQQFVGYITWLNAIAGSVCALFNKPDNAEFTTASACWNVWLNQLLIKMVSKSKKTKLSYILITSEAPTARRLT